MNIVDRADKIIEILTAYKSGGPGAVEYRRGGADMLWVHPYIHPGWDFDKIEWRLTLAPPKPREYSVRICPTLNSGLPQIGGIKKHWLPCIQCEVFHVIEVLPSSGEEILDEQGRQPKR